MLDEGTEYVFGENSLFALFPNERYASKHRPGTKVLFIKSPGGNDKVILKELPKEIEAWLSEYGDADQ